MELECFISSQGYSGCTRVELERGDREPKDRSTRNRQCSIQTGVALKKKKKSEPKRIYRLIPPVAYSIGLLCLLVTISSGIIGGGVLS